MKQISAKFSRAVRLHRAGQLAEAAALYKRVLDHSPRHAGALHFSGVIASEYGDHDLGALLMVRAIQASGASSDLCSNLGIALARAGRIEEAVACYRQALALRPDDAVTLGRMGRLLLQLDRAEEAFEGLSRSIALVPALAVAEDLFRLGNILHARGDQEPAAACYRTALSANSNWPEAHYNLGVVSGLLGQIALAKACYQRALAMNPDYPEAHTNLGMILQQGNEKATALKHYEEALRIAPANVDALYNRSVLYQEMDELEKAAAGFRSILDQRPNHTKARNNYGNTLMAMGEPGEAARQFRTILDQAPDDAEAHWNSGLAALLLGNYRDGWREHEWRHALGQTRRFSQPSWDGAPAPGKTVLLHAEQGLGDTLQFIRFAARVRRLVGAVIVECQPPLTRLLRTAAGIDQVVPRGADLPPFDLHAPLMSLPYLLGLDDEESLKTSGPYLGVDSELQADWRQVLAKAPGSRLNVGLTWAGNPEHKNDRNRSIPPAALELLAGIPGIQWIGVQKGPGSGAIPEGLELVRPEDRITDFADTAALLSTLDLLVSVDTSVAHLAGATGLRVWTLLAHAPDWRWRMNREDTPWYSSMRLFRQSRPKDWTSVLKQVREELASFSPRSQCG